MRNFGLRLEWIKDFVIGRRHKVRINYKCSSWKPVRSGVPQDFVVGILHVILYIQLGLQFYYTLMM